MNDIAKVSTSYSPIEQFFDRTKKLQHSCVGNQLVNISLTNTSEFEVDCSLPSDMPTCTVPNFLVM